MDGFHLDPLLGLFVPWAGDLVGAGLGLYPVMLAWKRGAPKALLARMLLNLSADLLAGAIPIVGDVWDFFFRAHRRNLHLLRARWDGGVVRSRPRDGLIVGAAVAVFLLALAAPIAVLVAVIAAIGLLSDPARLSAAGRRGARASPRARGGRWRAPPRRTCPGRAAGDRSRADRGRAAPRG